MIVTGKKFGNAGLKSEIYKVFFLFKNIRIYKKVVNI
jgi:hypothetical protein